MGEEIRLWRIPFENSMNYGQHIALKQRLESTSKLDVSKQLTLLSYLPRMFPADEEYVQQNIPEAQGAFSTIFPDELKLIKVGPIARACSVSTSSSLNREQTYCVHPANL